MREEDACFVEAEGELEGEVASLSRLGDACFMREDGGCEVIGASVIGALSVETSGGDKGEGGSRDKYGEVEGKVETGKEDTARGPSGAEG